MKNKLVKYSWWTAKVNPHMIANEYLRLIKETKRRMNNNEKIATTTTIKFKCKPLTTSGMDYYTGERAECIEVCLGDIHRGEFDEFHGSQNKIDYLFKLNRKVWNAVKELQYDSEILDDLITEARKFCKKHDIVFTESKNR